MKSSQDSFSWQEISELTHATQVEIFGWCLCEEGLVQAYDDCPQKLPAYAITSWAQFEDTPMVELAGVMQEFPLLWQNYLHMRAMSGEWYGLRDYVMDTMNDAGEAYFCPEDLERTWNKYVGEGRP